MSETHTHPSVSKQPGVTGRRALQIGAATGAVAAAGFASICCVGPQLIALLGIGNYGLIAAVDPYRPWLIALTLLLLAVGFVVTYGRRRRRPALAAAGGTDDAACASCARSRWSRVGRIALWVSAGLTVLLLIFPLFAPYVEPYLARLLLE